MQIGYNMLFLYKSDLRTETESTSTETRLVIKFIMLIQIKSNSLNLMLKNAITVLPY